MYLVGMTVRNFRGFFGEQHVEFAKPGERAVTVVHGENGAGKTNFLNALFWCFTGDFTPRFSNPELLVNKSALHDYGDGECFVEVRFNHEDVLYSATRIVIGNKDHRFSVNRYIGDRIDLIDNPNQFIERIIPKGLSRWFFFDAEAIGELELSGSEEFRKSLRRILGFELVDTLIDDLQGCFSKRQKNLTVLVNQKDLSDIQKKIDDIQAILPTQKNMADKLEADLLKLETEISNIDKKLRALPKSKPLYERRARLDANRKKALTTRNELQDQSNKYLGEIAPAIILASKSISFSGELHLKENTGRLPAPFSEQLVEDILHDRNCVCGRPVEPESVEEEKIRGLLKHASTTAFNNRIRSVQYLLKEITVATDGYTGRAKKYFIDIARLDSDVAEIDAELREIKDELRSIDEDSIRILEESRQKASSQLRELVGRHSVASHNIKANELKLAELKVRYDAQSKKVGQGGSVKAEMDRIQGLREHITRTLRMQENRALNILMINLNAVLDKYLTKHYIAKIHAKNYAVDLLDDKQRHVGRSTGEGQVLKFAFISTVVALAGRKTIEKMNFLAEPTVAPLVLDAPFSALDPEYQSSVAKSLADQTSQLVLLLSSAGWGDSVSMALNPYVGKRYVLISRQSGERGNKPVKVQNINGVEVKLNEYGCDRDETIIQEII